MGIKPTPKEAFWPERNKKTRTKAEVIKEVYVDETYDWGDYKKVLQLLKKKDDGTELIRLGYYVKNKGSSEVEYHWGSQTTFIATKQTFEKLIEKAKNDGIL